MVKAKKDLFTQQLPPAYVDNKLLLTGSHKSAHIITKKSKLYGGHNSDQFRPSEKSFRIHLKSEEQQAAFFHTEVVGQKCLPPDW